jgi:hypothetical protein
MVNAVSKYNKTFELSLEDMDLIETALRKKVAAQEVDCSAQPETRALKHKVNDLLGRLHSQKRFFRPTEGPYVSG